VYKNIAGRRLPGGVIGKGIHEGISSEEGRQTNYETWKYEMYSQKVRSRGLRI